MKLSIALSALLAVSLATPALPAPQPSRADAEKDPVLKAMLDELGRSMSQLQLKGFAKPFYIQYRIEDVDDFAIRAEFGASEGSDHVHQRVARITVRVGDANTDSSGGRGDGALQLASLDDDPIALRSALWAATDQAYKAALAAYAQKQAALKQVQTSPQADDFSQETPLISLAAPLPLRIDDASWSSRMAQASGLYRTDPSVRDTQSSVQYSNAQFHARVTTTWLVTSEGTIVRKSAAEYEENISVRAQADDGMSLERSYGSNGNSLDDLAPPGVFAQHTVELIASLAELRKAPLVEEEYHGPVLLSAHVSADTLRHLLAPGVIAMRPPLGTQARTNGPFASSYHARVLPEFLSVVDDPTLKSFDGKGLLGAYDVDDEGVPAQPVKLIDDGRLVNYLIGRQPVRDFPHSNGHGRAGIVGPPHPSIGVLQITAKDGLSGDDLNRKLLEMAHDQSLPSVYFVDTLGGAAVPRLLYRITPDGNRQLVRGAVLDDLDQRALRANVEAAGKDLYVVNVFGDIPETVIAPALLLDDMTIRRANEKNEKLPFYPPPQ